MSLILNQTRQSVHPPCAWSPAGASATQVLRLIEELANSGRGERRPAESPLAEGRWRLRWSAQVDFVLSYHGSLTARPPFSCHGHAPADASTCIFTRALHAQAEDANGLQKALANKVRNFQIVEDKAGPSRLENLVELAPFLKVRAGAACKAASRTRTNVDIDDARIELFGLRCMPLLSDLQCKFCTGHLSIYGPALSLPCHG